MTQGHPASLRRGRSEIRVAGAKGKTMVFRELFVTGVLGHLFLPAHIRDYIMNINTKQAIESPKGETKGGSTCGNEKLC
jgi:uncharacterized membrane protein SpoIIM required for sporulation